MNQGGGGWGGMGRGAWIVFSLFFVCFIMLVFRGLDASFRLTFPETTCSSGREATVFTYFRSVVPASHYLSV